MSAARCISIGLGLTALLGGLACSNDMGPNTAGVVSVSLTTPNADDGALLVTITGPGVTNPHAGSSGYRLDWQSVTADELRIIVVGDLSDGVLVTMDVAAVNRLGDYHGVVVEAASRTDQLRASLSGYSLTFGP